MLRKLQFQGALRTTKGPANVDRRLGDAHKIVLKAILCAWSRPEKPMDGFFRANSVARITYESLNSPVSDLLRLFAASSSPNRKCRRQPLKYIRSPLLLHLVGLKTSASEIRSYQI